MNLQVNKFITLPGLSRAIYKIKEWVESRKMINITYSELKVLRDGNKLIPGQQYRITDYITTTSQENTQSAGHQFDVIVLALDSAKLSEKAWAAHHEGDEYFKDSNLSAWQIWYCLDNDENRFKWAAPSDGKKRKVALVLYGYSGYTAYRVPASDIEVDGRMLYAWDQGGGPGQVRYSDTLNITSDSKVYTSSGDEDSSASFLVDVTEIEKGRGVIYRLIDEWGNDIAYDFKNIQYFVNNEWVYTFSEASELSGKSYSNVVKPYYASKIQKLNRILFGYGNFCNSFGIGCQDNTLGGQSDNNTFGNFCAGNTIGENCSSNTFGSSCGGNSLGNGCSDNTFGDNCLNNTMSGGCRSNIFGKYCAYNSFGENCSSNSFGNYCSSNSFGNYCSSNRFGNYCDSNKFGESRDNPKSYYRYIIFDNGNQYINLNCTSITSSSNYFQNVRIGLGVNNTTPYKTINDSNINQTFETKVGVNTNGEIKIYCEADLIA